MHVYARIYTYMHVYARICTYMHVYTRICMYMHYKLHTTGFMLSLACEAMIDSKDKKVDYVNIIDEENKRLGSQVERVLNIARTEKETYKLDRYPVNIHDIIHESVNIFKFKVEKKITHVFKQIRSFDRSNGQLV